MASLPRAAFRGALTATAITSSVAISAAMVRIFPWLLDPRVTWRVAMPFARSLSVVALEAALALGWPLGWALATLGFVERGEARVLALLGERPLRTVTRLLPQAVVLTALLGGFSWASARESTEPGRILSELIADGKGACARVEAPRTYTIPFLDATWLCGPDRPPRLVGEGPGRLRGVLFTATDARASGDLGSLSLDDARISLAHPRASLHVDQLRLHGAAPWGLGGATAPLARALSLGAAIGASSLAAAGLMLLYAANGRIRALAALATGAAGPATALGLLRVAERFPATQGGLVVFAPALAVGAVLAIAWTGARLPGLWHAASR